MKYQIIVELDSTTLFNATKDKDEIDKVVSKYVDSGKAKSVRIYQYDKDNGGYNLVQCLRRNEEPTRRLIGFGRW